MTKSHLLSLLLFSASALSGCQTGNGVVVPDTPPNSMSPPPSKTAEYVEPVPPMPLEPVAPQIYVVQQGDTISELARCFRVSQADLCALNRITNPNRVFVGQRLMIPVYAQVPLDGAVASACHKLPPDGGQQIPYIVKRGDTLHKLAARYRVSGDEIRRANQLPSDDIYVGQLLRIPTAAAPPTFAAEKYAQAEPVPPSPVAPVPLPPPPADKHAPPPADKIDTAPPPAQLTQTSPPPVKRPPPTPVQRICKTEFSTQYSGPARTVFLSGGKAPELLDKYIDEAKVRSIDLKLETTTVVFFNDQGKQENIRPSKMSIGEWFRGDTWKLKWRRLLKEKHAQSRPAPLEDAKQLQADLVCGDS